MFNKVVVFIVCVASIIPIYWLGLKVSGVGLEEIQSEILTSETGLLVIQTIWFAFVVTFFSIVISLPLAWLVMRSNLIGKTWWGILFALPLGIPSYVMATSYVLTFAKGGYLGSYLEGWGIDLYDLAYGFWPAVCVLTFVTYPYVFLSLCMGFKGVPDSLRHASSSLGMSRLQTFIKVEWPILVPSVLSGALLVFLYALSDFGAVATLKCETFTWVIYQQIESSWSDTVPALHSIILVLLTTVVLVIQWYFKKAQLTEASSQTEIVQLTRWQPCALFFCSIIVLLGIVMPLATLIVWSLETSQGMLELTSMTDEIGNSLLTSLSAVVVILFLSFPLALVAANKKKLWEPLIYIGFVLPGIVVGLSYVKFFSQLLPQLYFSAGLVVLVLAYLVRYLPEAFGILKARRLHMSANLESVSLSLGISRIRTFFRVTFPLMLPGVFVGGLLVFLTVLKELPITLILAPRDFSTLAMKVWMHVEEAEFSEAAVPSLVIMMLSALPLLYLSLHHRKSQIS